MKKTYWENRPEKTITRSYGSHKLKIRYLENCNKAQVTMYDESIWDFPLLWTIQLYDEQANAALTLFENCGYFDILAFPEAD